MLGYRVITKKFSEDLTTLRSVKPESLFEEYGSPCAPMLAEIMDREKIYNLGRAIDRL
jgi:hypothetical protein